jgi:peptide/nickel transport system substrate-binding protein
MRATECLEVVNDKTFELILKDPFGLVLEVLAKPSSNVPFIMPARVAATSADEQIKETIGAGTATDGWRYVTRIPYGLRRSLH